MPLLFKAMTCKSCGKPHDFYTPDDVIASDRQYSYACPATGEKETIVPWAAVESVTTRPDDAVLLALV